MNDSKKHDREKKKDKELTIELSNLKNIKTIISIIKIKV